MTMPPLPAKGATNWRDDWAQAVHNAATEVVQGRLTDAAQRAASVAVNAADYGMVADGVGIASFASVFTGTDNAAALAAAATAAQAAGKALYIPPGKYRLASTVTITGTITMSARGVTFLGDIRSKTAPVLKLVGVANGLIDGLHIIGAGFLPLAGIQFATADSQFCTLRSVTVNACRHGVYINEGEIANRIVLDSCALISNFIAGFYMKSFSDGGTYSQSGPIILRDTIVHANGIPTGWFNSATTYQGVTVQSAGDFASWQIWVKGFVNFQVRGGQISGDPSGGITNASLAHFENGAGVVLYGVDVEGLVSPVDAATGVVLTDRATLRTTPNDGAALIFVTCAGASLRDFHIWEIEAPVVVKFAYDCEDVRVDTLDWLPTRPDDAKYLVDVVGANYAPEDANASNQVRLWYDGNLKQLTADAWAACMNKGNARTVVDWYDFHLADNLNVHFESPYLMDTPTGKYLIGYAGADLATPDWTKAPYSTFPVAPTSVLYYSMVGTINYFDPDGRLLFGFFDGSGAQISVTNTATRTNTPVTGAPDIKYARYGRVTVPANARTVRIGFINAGNYLGRIDDHTGLLALTVWEAGGAALANTALDQIGTIDRALPTKVSSGTVNSVVTLTQAAYTALATKDAATLYVIVG